MVTIKNNFSRMFQAPSHHVHSNFRCQVFSTPDPELSKTTRFTTLPEHEIHSTLQPQNFQNSQSQTLDVPDRYSDQIRLHREWEEKLERLNNKYGLNYFSDSELDPESDEGEEYRYEHKYETLI